MCNTSQIIQLNKTLQGNPETIMHMGTLHMHNMYMYVDMYYTCRLEGAQEMEREREREKERERKREREKGREKRQRGRERFIGPVVAIRYSLIPRPRFLPLPHALPISHYHPAQHLQGQGTAQSHCRQGDRACVLLSAHGRPGRSVRECESWGHYD